MKRQIENIILDTDEILSQDQFKQQLVHLKLLFDDLKAVKLDSVKDYIMKDVFQTLGSVEKTADQLYVAIENSDKAIDRLESHIDRQSRLHELRVSKIMADHQTELDSIIDTDEDNKIDKALIKNAKKRKLKVGVNDEPELPKEEQDRYAQWLEESSLESAVDADNDTHQLTMDEILGPVSKKTLTDEVLTDISDRDENNDDVRDNDGEFMTSEEFFKEDKANSSNDDKPKDQLKSKKTRKNKSSSKKLQKDNKKSTPKK